ncbi:MAG: hypothetical protein V1735_06295 [Nanoarchaeota archaeon]
MRPLLFLFFVVALAATALAVEPCFQETAYTVTSGCGLDTGLYGGYNNGLWNGGAALAYDGNYGTATYVTATNDDTIHANWSKPLLATSATLQMKLDLLTKNLSINGSCWAASTEKILLGYRSYAPTDSTYIYCYEDVDATTPVLIYQENGHRSYHEDGVWWNFTGYSPAWHAPTPNESAVIGANTIFNCSYPGADIAYYLWSDSVPIIEGVENDTRFNWTSNWTADGAHNVTCSVFNATSSEWSSNVTRRVTFDTRQPDILYSNITNNSVFMLDAVNSSGNISGQLLFNDSDLYAVELRIDGDLLNQTTGITPPQFWFNFSIPVSNLSAGNHTLNLSAFDGHTARTIPEQRVSRDILRSKLTFEDARDAEDWLSVADADASLFSDDLEAERQSDRYTWTMHNADKKAALRFRVEAATPLSIVRDSKYPGHVIAFEQRRWVDFVANESGAVVTLEQESPTSIMVTITGLKGEDVRFSSTGYVNENSQIFKFYVHQATFAGPTSANERASVTMNLSVFLNGSGQNLSARLFDLGVEGVVTNKSDDKWINFSSTFITQATGLVGDNRSIVWNLSNHNNGNSTVLLQYLSALSVGIYNCSNSTDNITASFFMAVEESNLSVVRNLDITFFVHNADFTLEKNYSFALSENSSYHICLIAQNSSFLGRFVAVHYNGSDQTWRTRNFYVGDLLYSNASRRFDLYSANASYAVTYVYVKDYSDKPLVGAVIRFYRFFPGTGVWLLVESGLADLNGQAVMYFMQNSVTYRIEVDYGGKTYTVGEQYVAASTINIAVNTEGAADADQVVVEGIVTSLTYTNATKTFSWSYNDPSGTVTASCLIVSNGQGNELGRQCSASSGATLTVTLSGSLKGNYIGIGVSTIRGSDYLIDQAETYVSEGKDVFGKLGLFWTAFFVFTMVLIGWWHPTVGCMMGIAGIIGCTIMGLIGWQTGTVMTIIVLFAIIGLRGGKG